MKPPVTNAFREVKQELAGLLGKVSPDPREIDATVAELERRLGDQVYSELLYLLCHLSFPPAAAKSHWYSVLEHRQKLSEKLESGVDFRVALLDYFLTVNQQFKNPKIIEIKIFQKTQDFAFKDELTQLYNYRYFRSELEREIGRAQRADSPLSLALFDVDHFKAYNDRNGHLQGDKALRTIAGVIESQVRDTDLVARYGGEEFAVLLPDASKPTALEAAERICRKIAAHAFLCGDQHPGGKLTASGGVATLRADGTTATELVEAADRGLYLAKGSGRNQVLSAHEENRDCVRIETEIPGKLQVMASDTSPFLTDNVSRQGMQFHCGVALDEGDFFRFTMFLPESYGKVQGVARAIRAEKQGAEHLVWAQIMDLPFSHSEALQQYLDTRSCVAEATGEAVGQRSFVP